MIDRCRAFGEVVRTIFAMKLRTSDRVCGYNPFGLLLDLITHEIAPSTFELDQTSGRVEAIRKSPPAGRSLRRHRTFGQALRSALIEKAWLRWLPFPIILAIGTVAFMTPDERAMVATQAVHVIGYASPALLMAAAIGWMTFGRRWWLWSIAVLGALSLGMGFHGCWPAT
jgi:hypothetical protein